jgi:uncharacterized protein YjbI with pentapeptide repeats
MENNNSHSGENGNPNSRLEIIETKKVLDVKRAVIEDSRFEVLCMDRSHFRDVSAKWIKITDANLSDLEIEGAQLGGAFIHNIGMPPQGHPMFDPEARQRPLKFENCDLNNSTITDCDLSGVVIEDCNIIGMKINGVLVEDLLKQYNLKKQD